jgi:hypothetical protein
VSQAFNVGDTVLFAQRGLTCEVVADPEPQPGLVLCGWLDWREEYQEVYFLATSLVLVERARQVAIASPDI